MPILTSLGRTPLKLGMILAIGLLTACDHSKSSGDQPGAVPSSAPTDLGQARESFSRAVSTAFDSARPITSKDELLAHLNLPAERIGSFDLIQSNAQSTSAMLNAGFWCGPRGCICIGDPDCNDMFSTVCRSPSTGGECRITGRLVVCTCKLTRS